jgi:hypothetical protein
MSDMRAKAAEAAASLAARSSSLEEEDDSTAALAARLLAHMEAAAQRRQEAQQARRVRLATKHDLLLQRLVSDGARRERVGALQLLQSPCDAPAR